ncbi:MAG TPA: TonB-dependent receptor, partial [Candidatus Angelobacter sp.]
MKGLNRFCFLLGLVVILGILPVYAQVDYSTGTLRGTVTDPQGAVVPGATVTVTNPSTGVTKTAKTGGDGAYRIQALPPGSYVITVAAQGFSKEVAKGIEVTVGEIQSYDAHLKVGTASEIIEVSTENVPLIQTEQTQQANTINVLQVEELPNITHNITQQVYTLPGVANADAPRSQNPGFTGFFTTGFSIGGSNGRNNLSTIDGGENEYGTGQYRVTTIPYDTIQEYQVNRNAFAAEFGFTDGSAINIVTKSGGNKFHGTAYGYFQNHNTSATNFFNGIEGLPAAYSQNVYTGFTVGGPIKADKLSFFLGYEYRDLNNPDFTNANILSAPTVVGPSAAQTAYVNALKTSGDPFLAGFGNGITPGLTPLNNPALKKILTAENGIFINPTRDHNTLLRFDANPNSTNSLNLRLEYSHNDNKAGNPDGSGLFTRDFSILSTWNHTFTPSVLNQVLVQVVPRNVANNLPNPFQGVNFSLGNLNTGNLGGTSSFGSPSLVPYKAHQQRYQFDDNLTWNHGRHSIKFGAQIHLANYTVEDDLWFNNQFDFRDGLIPLFSLAPSSPVGPCPPFPFPAVQLSPVQCHLALFNVGHGFPVTGPANTNLSAPQSFAFGIPVDVLGGFNNPTWTGWGKYFGGFIQDAWKITPRFTLNAGVRFDVDSEPAPLANSFYASPRLGFAWDPWGDQKTVIRGGAGVMVAPVDVLIPSYGSLLDGSGRYINEVLGILSPTDPRVAQLWGTGVALGILPFGKLTPQQFQQFSTTPSLPGYDPNASGATVGYGVSPNYKN